MTSRRFKFLQKKHDGGDWRITSPFGHRRNPITGKPEGHKGIDINTYSWTKVFAPIDGEIVLNRPAHDGSGGNMVCLLGRAGQLLRFLHLLEKSTHINIGDRVKAGDLICNTGNTGWSTGAHLHLDIQVGGSYDKTRSTYIGGEYIDPVPYLTQIGMLNLDI